MQTPVVTHDVIMCWSEVSVMFLSCLVLFWMFVSYVNVCHNVVMLQDMLYLLIP